MNFEVDTDELRFCEKKLTDSSERLTTEINYWYEQIEKLKSIWSGSEADVFYTKLDGYLMKLKMLSETTNVFGKTIKQCYINYERTDNSFAGIIKEENSKYDDEAYLKDPRNNGLYEEA